MSRADVEPGGEADKELLARDGAGLDQDKNRKTDGRNRARTTDQCCLGDREGDAQKWLQGPCWRRSHALPSQAGKQHRRFTDTREPCPHAPTRTSSAQGSSQPPVKPRDAADLQTAAWVPTPGCPPPAPPCPCDPGQATDPMQPELPDPWTGALGGLL